MFVLLLTPYKVGSRFVEKTLQDSGVPYARLHGYDETERAQYPPENVTHYITIERDSQLDLYISAYYADIDQAPHYGYSFASSRAAVDAAPMRALVAHFFKQQWPRYRWLNYEYYRGWTRWFARRNVPTMTLKTETLSTDLPKRLPAFCKTPVAWKIYTTPSHVTKESPGGERYLELKRQIKLEHQRRSYWVNKNAAAQSIPLRRGLSGA